MSIRFGTETGSVYEINGDRCIRLMAPSITGDNPLRQSGTAFAIRYMSAITVGRPVFILSDPIDASKELRKITTSNVKWVMEKR